MAPVPSHSAHPDDAPESYVGLDAEDAGRLARSRGWTTVRSLPPGSIITMEYLAGRTLRGSTGGCTGPGGRAPGW
ncbi:proteinase inhibitor I78 [Streptomyces hundungensis]|uniref:proteinase inhibitor I78 n=1 Tax=Streptomyces hundungensis TaxID=1077946 RepID=UPI0033C5658B